MTNCLCMDISLRSWWSEKIRTPICPTKRVHSTVEEPKPLSKEAISLASSDLLSLRIQVCLSFHRRHHGSWTNPAFSLFSCISSSPLFSESRYLHVFSKHSVIHAWRSQWMTSWRNESLNSFTNHWINHLMTLWIISRPDEPVNDLMNHWLHHLINHLLSCVAT
jgi:uncharacterized membrane protein YoaT (DUF817 family)